jgi:ribonuclease HI
MRIDLVCAGACRDNGKPTQIAGCGVIVRFVDEHERVQSRQFGWALGGSTSNLADIMAARLALSSVLPQFRGNHTALHISNMYVFDLLVGEKNPRKNKEEVSELRRWFGYYKDITIILYNKFNAGGDVMDTETIARVQELAKRALESQEHYDSGTVGVDDVTS